MITFNVLEGAKIINEKRFSAKKSRGARMLRSGAESAACPRLLRSGAESELAPGP